MREQNGMDTLMWYSAAFTAPKQFLGIPLEDVLQGALAVTAVTVGKAA